MTKLLSICIILLTVVLFSCEKERGEAIACIDTGSATFKAGKDIRFMNCSKNYDGTKWYIVNGNNNLDTLFKETTDTLKHFKTSFVADTFDIHLVVWQADSVSMSSASQKIIVLP